MTLTLYKAGVITLPLRKRIRERAQVGSYSPGVEKLLWNLYVISFKMADDSCEPRGKNNRFHQTDILSLLNVF